MTGLDRHEQRRFRVWTIPIVIGFGVWWVGTIWGLAWFTTYLVRKFL